MVRKNPKIWYKLVLKIMQKHGNSDTQDKWGVNGRISVMGSKISRSTMLEEIYNAWKTHHVIRSAGNPTRNKECAGEREGHQPDPEEVHWWPASGGRMDDGSEHCKTGLTESKEGDRIPVEARWWYLVVKIQVDSIMIINGKAVAVGKKVLSTESCRDN